MGGQHSAYFSHGGHRSAFCLWAGGPPCLSEPVGIVATGPLTRGRPVDPSHVSDLYRQPPPSGGISTAPTPVGAIAASVPIEGGIPVSSTIGGSGMVDPHSAPSSTSIDVASDRQPGREFELSQVRGTTGSLHHIRVLVEAEDESPDLGPETVLVTPGKTCHVEKDEVMVEVLSLSLGKKSPPSTWQAYRKALMFNEGTPAPSTLHCQVPGAQHSMYRHKCSRVPWYHVMTDNGFMVVDAAQYRKMFPEWKRLPSTVIARENGDTATKIRRRVSMRWGEFHDTMAQRQLRVCRGLPVMGPLPVPVKINR